MAEYIKRIDVMKICESYSEHCFNSSDAKGQDIADRILDDVVEIPTADVAEVAKITKDIEFAIKATNKNSDYDVGLRNGLRLSLSLIDGKKPRFEQSCNKSGDVEEVVRCGDCDFWGREHISCEGYARCNTGETGIRYRKAHDFCSKGRKLMEVRSNDL